MQNIKLSRIIMKKIIVFLILTLSFSLVFGSVCSGAEGTISIDEATELLTKWEELHVKYYDTILFYEYIENHGGRKTDWKTYYNRSDNFDPPEYREFYDALTIDPIGGKQEITALFEEVFTSDMAKKAVNNSNLMFDGDKAYLPSVVAQAHFLPVLNYLYGTENSPLYGYDLQKYGCVEFKDRLRIIPLNNGRFKLEFDYYKFVDDGQLETFTSSVTVTKTNEGYRVCEFDNFFFRPDPYADNGYRKNMLENPGIPQTSDSAVYITAAAGVAALCLAVVCRKKLRKA